MYSIVFSFKINRSCDKKGAKKMTNKKRTIFIGGMIVIAILIISWIINIKHGKIPYLDQWSREYVILFADTSIYMIFRWMTELGSKPFMYPFTIVMTIILWIWYKDFRPALIFGLGTLGAHLLNKLIKVLVMRDRPSISELLNAEGYSFPSGHAMVPIVCYGLLAYFISRKCSSVRKAQIIQLSFYILIFLIGFSRYVINVHYLTDVISGYFFGFIILMGLIHFYELWKRKSVNKI